MQRGIVAAGNFIVDYVKVVDRYPTEQSLANISEEFSGSGGAPYNVLRNLALLGGNYPLAAIGRVGDDSIGAGIIEDCQQLGIDTTRLAKTPGLPTSYTIVMAVQGTGRRTFFHQGGANASLTPADFDLTGLADWHLHYGYLLLLDGMDVLDDEFGTAAARVLAGAKKAGLTTSVDLVSEESERFKSLVMPALMQADIVFMNEIEAGRTSGIDVLDAGSLVPSRVAEVGKALNLPGTLVLHWESGAAAYRGGEEVAWQGAVDLPLSEIRSLVGCGDAFAAGYLDAFMEGRTTSDALEQGCCCAAVCATGYTCTDAAASAEVGAEMSRKYGFRPCP